MFEIIAVKGVEPNAMQKRGVEDSSYHVQAIVRIVQHFNHASQPNCLISLDGQTSRRHKLQSTVCKYPT